jgi:hypothetical protein
MNLQFTTSSQISNSNGIKIMVYSGSGMGKTSLVATLPRPIMLSAESGALCLRPQNIARMFGADNPQITYDIPIIVINNLDDMRKSYQWLLQNPTHFDSIALDSISEIAEVVLADEMKKCKDGRIFHPAMVNEMIQLVKGFRDFPQKHVYFSAKAAPIKNELTGAVLYGIQMPGNKLSPQLPYLFDEMYYLGVKKAPDGSSFRFLQTQPDFQFDAKSRSGALAPIEVPNLTHIINKILGD